MPPWLWSTRAGRGAARCIPGVAPRACMTPIISYRAARPVRYPCRTRPAVPDGVLQAARRQQDAVRAHRRGREEETDVAHGPGLHRGRPAGRGSPGRPRPPRPHAPAGALGPPRPPARAGDRGTALQGRGAPPRALLRQPGLLLRRRAAAAPGRARAPGRRPTPDRVGARTPAPQPPSARLVPAALQHRHVHPGRAGGQHGRRAAGRARRARPERRDPLVPRRRAARRPVLPARQHRAPGHGPGPRARRPLA